jgi:hypothetical protein
MADLARRYKVHSNLRSEEAASGSGGSSFAERAVDHRPGCTRQRELLGIARRCWMLPL